MQFNIRYDNESSLAYIIVFCSELNCEPNEVSLGDEVEFSTMKKNGKVNAERITKIPNGSIPQEVIAVRIFTR